ncbi:GH1 family beta-glucosidase [Streptomyces sp. HNM0574]|uniref:GH1 family beta-glucosidase n=1 Tax=Streptomyces sp. HNM0574 TaxID=2714954 RepID=UPI001469F094|nr:GH1 family beta-glucosidase [Streptomyces sp. HNM0574]NLU69168.1 beta-glucosidase [Streptomyces sp. HNM0574]
MTPSIPVSPQLPLFPHEFSWGVATSAYQVEGAAEVDGRGPAGWDVFAGEPGRVRDGSTGAGSGGHYRRVGEDVGLMRELGVGAYRFSVAWPRVVPEGEGRVNPAGLDFYDRLVDRLVAAGIDPVVTLYHWDTPLPLEERGGWLVRETALRFAEYADAVAARLADRVAHWIPLNEPAEVTLLGYGLGQHAPGRRLLFDALPAAHHQLLAHGLAVGVLRARGARSVGTANSHGPVHPLSEREEDVAAAGLYDTLTNRLFADPVLLGRYPDGFGELMPGPVHEDLAQVAQPLDRYGVNYYQPTLVGAPRAEETTTGGVTLPAELPFSVHEMPGVPRTGFGWPVVPEGLPETLRVLGERYGEALPPLLVTENGCAYPEEHEDHRRIAYLESHLRALHGAVTRDGADVRGYFVWSLLDNFEWAEGRTQRFGLVHVDWETQRRTPKASYHWLREVLRAQAAARPSGRPRG